MKTTKFQERFCECIRFSDVTQVELAKAINVTKQCISDYKSGRIVPSIDTLFLICKFLDVSADYLLGLTD
ncbi:MAG: helix-turn-helix domain-containing protein [Clostridiales bacterium]|nr:helix-turn-helix domain-containing protein [Clostridiales bacterium]